jgi:hypothetical protein
MNNLEYFQLATSYDQERNITDALLILKRDLFSPFIKILHQDLKAQLQLWFHPLLLPLFLIEGMIYRFLDSNIHTTGQISSIQAVLGQEDPELYHTRGQEPRKSLDPDFPRITRKIISISDYLAMHFYNLKSCPQALDQLLEWSHSSPQSPPRITTDYPTPQSQVKNVLLMLKEKIEYLKDTCNVELMYAECVEKKAQIMTQAVSLKPFLK